MAVLDYKQAAQPTELETDRVFVFLQEEDTGLCLAQRRKKDGTWGLTGGQVDAGESPREAALRECDEEIGYVPSNIEEIFAFPVTTEEGERKLCRIFKATVSNRESLKFTPCPKEVSGLLWALHNNWPTPPHRKMPRLIKSIEQFINPNRCTYTALTFAE
ncbi:MAG: NUDIX hydrolase [Alphaproteobacteria bacterium]|nr:NUDIX hydrolase [Alphaproteobacteria bacterium]